MVNLQSIEIDWEIHQIIERERKSFSEAPYIALRRLLGLGESNADIEIEINVGSGIPWVEDGVEVPHGSWARMEYLRGTQVYEGRFLNGKLVVNGKGYDSLTSAANALAVTKNGSKTSLNGWLYWKVKFPGDSDWHSLKEMRNK